MTKLEFVHEVGDLANRFAFLFQEYMTSHDGYGSVTEDDKPIIIADIGVSIQDGELATINVDIGSVNSKHRIKINRCPSSENSEWRIEDE